eukprot:9465622-Pyramimonas_sp.AAC.1
MDPCIFYLYDEGQLCGLIATHVDDTLSGGYGEKYRVAIQHLRKSFPFRKWCVGQGEFGGSSLWQDPHTFDLIISQQGFATET